MSKSTGPFWAIMLCGGLAACGGGGGGSNGGGQTVVPAAAPSFKTLAAPSGFAPATASMKTTNVNADAVMAGGEMPVGYADPLAHTCVTFSYLDDAGVARTLAVVRWTAFAHLGSQGLRLELPSAAAGLRVDVYNANDAKSGSVSL